MKKLIGIFFLGLFLISVNGYAATKIDPTFNYLRFVHRKVPAGQIAAKMVAVKTEADKTLVGCLIEATDLKAVSEYIEKLGGKVGVTLKTVMTAELPLASVEEIAALDEVVYIEASKKLTRKMNVARNDGISNVVSVQNGTGLSQPYDGDGAIVGIIDSGIDCSHPDFSGRIIAFKDMGSGTEYTQSQIDAGACTDSEAHGTHVTGIAASANSTYKGVAPGASIVGVKLGTSSESEIVEAVSYVFQKAQELLAPVVANLSVGTSLGSHDGTSTFERGLDQLLEGKEGRAIVNAGGNENVNAFDDAASSNVLGGIHATVNVAGGTDTAFEFIIRDRRLPTGACAGTVKADIWLSQGSDCDIELDIYPLNSKAAPSADMSAVSPGDSNQGSPISVGNIDAYVDFTDDNNAQNGMQHAQAVVDFPCTTGGTDPTTFSYDLVFRPGSSGCTGHAWLWPDFTAHTVFTKNRIVPPVNAYGGYGYVNGDSNYTITIPGTAAGLITVASFSARNTWVDINGTTQNQDVYESPGGGTGTSATDISLFSSLGPGAGSLNTQKPDITAPGEPIISSLSSSVPPSSIPDAIKGDSNHWKLEGTSMAAPFVSGVIALLFQKNGCLTPDEVRSALINNVITDAFTGGSLPNYIWGYGKVDALAAIQSISSSDCQPDNPGDNPSSSGSSSCSLIANDSVSGVLGMLPLLLVGIFMGLRRIAINPKS